MTWDHEFDFIAVGSGTAGLTAAVTAHEKGLKTLVVEKSNAYGGTSGISGGVIWIPNNHYMKEEGIPDSEEDSLAHLEAVAGNFASSARKQAFAKRAPEALDFLEEHSEAEFQISPNFIDYYMELPGAKERGRSLDPVPAEGGIYKRLAGKMGPRYDEIKIGPMRIAAATLGAANAKGKLALFGLIARAGLAHVFGSRSLCEGYMGSLLNSGYALNGRIVATLMQNNVPIWLSSAATDLITEDGKVTGLEVNQNGKTVRVKANKGVLLAAGGFAHNKEMREQHHFKEVANEFSWALKEQTGDTIKMAMAAGAAVDQMDAAWWTPMIKVPGMPFPMPSMGEGKAPGIIFVNSGGKRFINEAAPYVDYGRAVWESDKTGASAVPAYMILDQGHRDATAIGPIPPGPVPQPMIDSGFIKRADTIADLAAQIGVDANALSETVKTFNDSARQGKDPEFKKGEHEYDHYAMGGPRIDKVVGPVEKAPFYAVEIWPGDFGTKGGLVCDEHSRVMTGNGVAIEGLYSAGNDAVSVFGDSYSSGGCVNGEALVWGYLAATDAAN